MKDSFTINEEQCEYVSAILKNLAHPQRLMLLCLLVEKERSVTELVHLTSLTQSGVSQYLNRMKMQGILASKRSGTSVCYSIADERILKLMQSLHEIYCPR